jgi:hypothetical protein
MTQNFGPRYFGMKMLINITSFIFCNQKYQEINRVKSLKFKAIIVSNIKSQINNIRFLSSQTTKAKNNHKILNKQIKIYIFKTKKMVNLIVFLNKKEIFDNQIEN